MDYVRAFLFEDLDIRGVIVHLGNAWRAMQSGRGYGNAARTLLGEMTAVTALIGSNLKTPGRLSFQLQGHGALRLMVVDCDNDLHLRGMARIDESAQNVATESLTGLFGDGRLVLTLQNRERAEQPYQSFVPLEGSSIAEIFEHYLALSEQTPSRLWLTADSAYACGLFLQKLPGADARDADGWQRVQILADTLQPAELTLPPETLLSRLFPEENVRLFDAREALYHCPRDEGKVLDMLRALGREEIQSLIAERGEIVIQDEICNHEYRFGPDVIDRLFPPESRTLH